MKVYEIDSAGDIINYAVSVKIQKRAFCRAYRAKLMIKAT
jgi:hypothetical protein